MRSTMQPPSASLDANQTEAVVIAHGLWLNGHAMGLVRSRLAHLGHRASVFSYHSVHLSLSANAQKLHEATKKIDADRLHFVGHSLGGSLIAQMLAEYDEPRFGRVVLAGAPYRGIFVASTLSRYGIAQQILGHSVRQWLHQEKPNISERHQVGVIAGTRSVGLGRVVRGLPSPNDGTITVEETKVPGMTDFLMLHVSHSEMLISAQVARQIDRFLRTARFDHGAQQ